MHQSVYIFPKHSLHTLDGLGPYPRDGELVLYLKTHRLTHRTHSLSCTLRVLHRKTHVSGHPSVPDKTGVWVTFISMSLCCLHISCTHFHPLASGSGGTLQMPVLWTASLRLSQSEVPTQGHPDRSGQEWTWLQGSLMLLPEPASPLLLLWGWVHQRSYKAMNVRGCISDTPRHLSVLIIYKTQPNTCREEPVADSVAASMWRGDWGHCQAWPNPPRQEELPPWIWKMTMWMSLGSRERPQRI